MQRHYLQQHACNVDGISHYIHKKMQHPIDGMIAIGYIPAGFIDSLNILKEYFDPQSGKYLLDAEVKKISLANIDLSENTDIHLNGSPAMCIADLIVANPDIESLELIASKLSFKGFGLILSAFNEKTRLREIVVKNEIGSEKTLVITPTSQGCQIANKY